MSKKIIGKRIVCIGGGTGNFVLLSGLKKYPVNLSVIVTMFDDGGSSGILRDELGILPPGDIRQCLVALSGQDLLLRNLFNYRFLAGTFKGHNFGNVFMAAVEKLTGSFDKAIEAAGKILNISGQVIPVTLNKARLAARFMDNSFVSGEKNVTKSDILLKGGLKELFLEPKNRVKANPQAILAIKKADLIVIGPGNFYSSILPNFLVKGISEAIRRSKAKKVFNCNLMTKMGQTDNFCVADFLSEIEKFLGQGIIDYVIFNDRRPGKAFLKKYAEEGSCLVDFNKNILDGKKFIGADLINLNIVKRKSADIFLKRSLIRHNPGKLAEVIMSRCLKSDFKIQLCKQ